VAVTVGLGQAIRSAPAVLSTVSSFDDL